MQIALIGGGAGRPFAHDGNRVGGFSLLEMMMVVTLILMVATISTPIFNTAGPGKGTWNM